MKQHSAEYLAWYKFLYVQGLTTAAKKLIYKAICEKKITIEELFVTIIPPIHNVSNKD